MQIELKSGYKTFVAAGGLAGLAFLQLLGKLAQLILHLPFGQAGLLGLVISL
jgi:hypothetical protein